MNRHATDDTIGAILDIHAMVSGFLAEAVDDVPESRMAEQPGGLVNHPAWTLSHMNAYAAMLLAILGDPGGAAAEAEMERFGYGTTPVPDLSAYAPKRALLDGFRERNARLAAVVRERHAVAFPKPPPERFRPTPTVGHLAITLLVAHPGHHLGQLRQWRRAAGLAGRG